MNIPSKAELSRISEMARDNVCRPSDISRQIRQAARKGFYNIFVNKNVVSKELLDALKKDGYFAIESEGAICISWAYERLEGILPCHKCNYAPTQKDVWGKLALQCFICGIYTGTNTVQETIEIWNTAHKLHINIDMRKICLQKRDTRFCISAMDGYKWYCTPAQDTLEAAIALWNNPNTRKSFLI